MTDVPGLVFNGLVGLIAFIGVGYCVWLWHGVVR